MRALSLAAFLLTTCLLLGACGQKGPLYLPDREPDQSQESGAA